MSEKVFKLITAISGAVTTAGAAVVAYIEPSYTPAIVAAIGIVNTAIVEICSLFRKI